MRSVKGFIAVSLTFSRPGVEASSWALAGQMSVRLNSS